MGMAGAVILGAFSGGLIIMGITSLIDYFKNKKLIKLTEFMEKLIVKMIGLEEESKKFDESIRSIAYETSNYALLVEKCIRYSSDGSANNEFDGTRVVVMANNMIETTKMLKISFEKIREEARMKETGLRKLILLNNPHAFFDDK